jgi:hypothetical protein
MDGALRIIDRGLVFDAARHALTLHQWLAAPDFDQEGEVQRAEQALAASAGSGGSVLLAAAHGMHAWLEKGESRPPIRAALVRAWMRHRLLSVPVPLTGPKALAAEVPFAPVVWLPICSTWSGAGSAPVPPWPDGDAPPAPCWPWMCWPPPR